MNWTVMRLRFGFVILLGFFLSVTRIFVTFAYQIVTRDGRVPPRKRGRLRGSGGRCASQKRHYEDADE